MYLCIYRSPNQSQDEIKTFINNLELILDRIFETNPSLVIVLGDFNTKLSEWYKNDKTITEGSKIANLEFNWEGAFHRKNINKKVAILNNTINNALSNFIRHKTITCDDKKPPWFNKNIINLIKNRNIFYKSHTANENSTDKKEAIKTLQNKLTSTIENAKSEYYSKMSMKLSNADTSSKA